MLDLSYDAYAWIKALHILAATAWIGGLVALGEVLALHAAEGDAVWAGRERALLARVVIPASGVSLVSGGALLLNYADFTEGWLHAKLTAVAALLVYQTWLARQARRFAESPQPPRTFGRLKLFPIVLFIGIVALVMVRPF
jgi:putative membrane protein